MAGCEAPTLPLCYAVPPPRKVSLVVMSFRKIVTEPTIVLHSRTIFPLSEPFPPEGRNVRFVLNIFPAFIKKLILFGFRKVFLQQSRISFHFILTVYVCQFFVPLFHLEHSRLASPLLRSPLSRVRFQQTCLFSKEPAVLNPSNSFD